MRESAAFPTFKVQLGRCHVRSLGLRTEVSSQSIEGFTPCLHKATSLLSSNQRFADSKSTHFLFVHYMNHPVYYDLIENCCSQVLKKTSSVRSCNKYSEWFYRMPLPSHVSGCFFGSHQLVRYIHQIHWPPRLPDANHAAGIFTYMTGWFSGVSM